MLDKVKLALRITTDVFDDELNDLIRAAELDLGVAGVAVPGDQDELTALAVVTYCKLHFGEPDNYDRLKQSYDEQKGQLAIATGYTDWGCLNG